MSDLSFGEGAVSLGGKRPRWRRALGVGLLLGSVILAGVAFRDLAPWPGPAIRTLAGLPSAEAAPRLPAAPVAGVLTLAVPPGADDDQQAGGRGYEMPAVINLRVGETIILRNDDAVPHMILYAFLMPGEEQKRTFTKPGSEVYSSGCGVHAASILNFTTIFVSA